MQFRSSAPRSIDAPLRVCRTNRLKNEPANEVKNNFAYVSVFVRSSFVSFVFLSVGPPSVAGSVRTPAEFVRAAGTRPTDGRNNRPTDRTGMTSILRFPSVRRSGHARTNDRRKHRHRVRHAINERNPSNATIT